MNIETIITFVVYLVFLLGVGVYFYNKTSSVEDYLLGGRGLGSWVTALSAQASDMSGWLLMGLPGALYINGFSEIWIAIGLFIGTWCNWGFIAKRLRIYTEKTNTLTMATFFEERFKDPTGLLRNITAIITLIFFTIYSASGLVGAGKLFNSLFNIDYRFAVIVGAFVVVGYTFLGGFLAVSWTDFFQGILMFIAITVVPVVAYKVVGGMNPIITEAQIKGISLGVMEQAGKPISLIAIISAASWGIGYFGQPHILVRFMGINSVKDINKSRIIALIWVLLSLSGAVLVGIIGIGLFPDIKEIGGDKERVFIYMIIKLFNPWVAGFFLAAILSAIMSTIDSQLLVASSTLAEDFYSKVVRKDASNKEIMWVSRIGVIVISIIAILIAMNGNSEVLGLVAYAWAGFGAAFGPVVIMSLFSKRTTWQSAICGMVVGTIVLLIWKTLGYDSKLYEIVPGFLANIFTIMLFNNFYKQEDEYILNQYDEMEEELQS